MKILVSMAVVSDKNSNDSDRWRKFVMKVVIAVVNDENSNNSKTYENSNSCDTRWK